MFSQKEEPVLHFLTVGLVKLCWRHSRTALFVYVLPFWLYLFSMIAVRLGSSTSPNDPPALTAGLYCAAILCLLLMLGSQLLGFRYAYGFLKIVCMIQIGVAGLFSLASIYSVSHNTTRSDFQFLPQSAEAIVTMFIMFLLFLTTVAVDLFKAFMENNRAME